MEDQTVFKKKRFHRNFMSKETLKNRGILRIQMVRLHERVENGQNFIRSLASANGKWQFSTFLNFEKSKTKLDLFMLFSKIGHQIDYFGKIKRNSKFQPCRRTLDIYSNWLLKDNIASKWKDLQEVQASMCSLLKEKGTSQATKD